MTATATAAIDVPGLPGLTDRQARVYTYFFEETCRNGFQPSLREAMRHFGAASPNGVRCHLRTLERKGWLVAPPKQSRALHFARNLDGTPFRGLAPR